MEYKKVKYNGFEIEIPITCSDEEIENNNLVLNDEEYLDNTLEIKKMVLENTFILEENGDTNE